MDDKCPSCGEWTHDAWERSDGLYSDGTEMDYCDCGYDESQDEEDAPSRIVDMAALGMKHGEWIVGPIVAELEVAWDLGVSLPDGHPFAPIVDGGAAA